MTKQKGFTLVELMMAILIIGILGAIALPNYHSYQIQAKSIEALTVSSLARTKITNFFHYTGTLPVNNRAAGIPLAQNNTGSWISSMTILNGAIHVKFSDKEPELAGKYLSLRPTIVIGEPTAPLYFICGYSKSKSVNVKIQGINKTNIHKSYLPATCR